MVAYAKTAWKSFFSSSGYSSSSSFSVIPLESALSICSTVILMPLIVGLPTIIFGLMVILDSRFSFVSMLVLFNFSVRDRGTFNSDQSAIWDEVSKKARRRDAVSPSMAMGEIYEKEKPAIDQYREGFTIIDTQGSRMQSFLHRRRHRL